MNLNGKTALNPFPWRSVGNLNTAKPLTYPAGPFLVTITLQEEREKMTLCPKENRGSQAATVAM